MTRDTIVNRALQINSSMELLLETLPLLERFSRYHVKKVLMQSWTMLKVVPLAWKGSIVMKQE